MIVVPPTFVVDVLRREGEAGRQWLDSLPAQAASCCADWGLTLDGAPMHGGLSLMVPVRRTMTEPGDLAAHLDRLCAAAALNPERVRAWSLVRCLDYWLWGLSVGLTEDPLRCARVVDWLGWR